MQIRRYFTSAAIFSLILAMALLSGCRNKKAPVGTSGGEGQPPYKPANLRALFISETEILLTWQDRSDNEDGFEVHESVNDDTSFYHLTTTPPNTDSLWLRDKSRDSTYYYRVQAFNEFGQSLFSDTAEATKGAVILTFERQDSPCLSVSYCPDGTEVISGWGDFVIRVWSVINGDLIRIYTGHENMVTAIAFSPDSVHFASGSNDNSVRIWNFIERRMKYTLMGHIEFVNCLAFSPDGRFLASGSIDRTVQIWKVDTGEHLLTLYDTTRVFSVAYSPDGRYLASAVGMKVRIWDPSNGEALLTLLGEDEYVNAVAFSPDGEQLATGSANGTVALWNTRWEDRIGETVHNYEILLYGHEDSIFDVAYSPNGRYLASGSRDDTIIIWDPVERDYSMTLSDHEVAVYSIDFSPDSHYLASASGDRTVKIWGYFY